MQDGCDPFVIMVFAKTTLIENWTHPLMTASLTEIVLPQRPRVCRARLCSSDYSPPTM